MCRLLNAFLSTADTSSSHVDFVSQALTQTGCVVGGANFNFADLFGQCAYKQKSKSKPEFKKKKQNKKLITEEAKQLLTESAEDEFGNIRESFPWLVMLPSGARFLATITAVLEIGFTDDEEDGGPWRFLIDDSVDEVKEGRRFWLVVFDISPNKWRNGFFFLNL